MKRLLPLIAFFLLSSPAMALTVSTETRQTFTATGVKPNTPYATYFYSIPFPGGYYYALSYSGLGSNAAGVYKSSVLIGDLTQEYEGHEGTAYAVKACLLEPPQYNEVACTPYEYAGYIPLTLWTYKG